MVVRVDVGMVIYELEQHSMGHTDAFMEKPSKQAFVMEDVRIRCLRLITTVLVLTICALYYELCLILN